MCEPTQLVYVGMVFYVIVVQFFGLFLDGMLGKVYERGLENLDRAVRKGA